MTTILGIDPGTRESAYVVWDGEKILAKGIVPNGEMREVSHAFAGECVVVEKIVSYGMAVGDDVFETVWWSGRFHDAACVPAERMPRGEVKMHICHSMRAKDGNIRQALIDRFGAPGTKKAPGLTYGLKADIWQAFALAVTYYDLHMVEETDKGVVQYEND